MVGHTSYDFSGESAIITGSTKGISRDIAEVLASANANVVVNSRTEADVIAVAEELDKRAEGEVIGVSADMARLEDIENLVETAVEVFGEIDLLVNNAAVWPREGSLVEGSIEDWDFAMDVNVRAQYYASKLVAAHMIDHGIEGSIINHTSQTGDRRSDRRGLYGISKTAINGLTWRMAHELAEHGIRMNAISTDVTETYQLHYEAEMIAEDDFDRTPKMYSQSGTRRVRSAASASQRTSRTRYCISPATQRPTSSARSCVSAVAATWSSRS